VHPETATPKSGRTRPSPLGCALWAGLLLTEAGVREKMVRKSILKGGVYRCVIDLCGGCYVTGIGPVQITK
jgi:hypothetical protein